VRLMQHLNSCRLEIGKQILYIGLSMVAKCGVSNGKFDLTVEGPVQHPVSTVIQGIFKQMQRTDGLCRVY